MNLIYLLKRWKYKLVAPHRLGFGIHSPSLFAFLTEVVFDTHLHDEYLRIEEVYPARIPAEKKKYGRLICRIIKNIDPLTVLEISSKPGLKSLYLAAGSDKAEYFCFNEKSRQSKRIKHLTEIIKPNRNEMNGNIGKNLPVALNSREKWDVFYLNYYTDYKLAYQYFQLLLAQVHPETIVIVDFIHLSKAAEKFWQKVIAHSEVRQSVDMFEIGILFFHEGMQKEDFVVKV